MRKEFFAKRRTLILLLGAALALVLALALAVGLGREARRRADLLAQQSRDDADRLTATTAAPPADPRTMTGFQLIAAHHGGLNLYYFGDSSAYGRGMADELRVESRSWRAMVKEELAARCGMTLSGYVDAELAAPPLSRAAYLFPKLYRHYDGAHRLMLLVPSSETAAAGQTGAPYADGYTGEFAHDLEALVRLVRTTAPLCDILLAIPPNVTAEEATAIRAVGIYYGLFTVDLRDDVGEALLHTAGADVGYPKEEGHAAYATAIADAIMAAANEGFRSGSVPEKPLYE